MSKSFLDMAPVTYLLEGTDDMLHGYVARDSLAKLDIDNSICVYSFRYGKNEKHLTFDRWVRVGNIMCVDGMEEFVPIKYYPRDFFKTEPEGYNVRAYIRRTQVRCLVTADDYIKLYDKVGKAIFDEPYQFVETGCKIMVKKLIVFNDGDWGPYTTLLESNTSNETTDTCEKDADNELPIRYDTFPGDYMSGNSRSDDSKPDDLIEFYILNETNEYEKVNVSRREVKEVAETIRLSDTHTDGFRVSGYDNEGKRYGSVEVKLALFSDEASSMRLIMDKRSYSSGKVKVIMHSEQSSECIIRFVGKGQLDYIFKKDLSYFELNDEAIDIYEDEEAEDPIKTVSLKDIEIDPNYMGQEMFDIFNSVINKED